MKALGGQMPDAEYLDTERLVQGFLDYADKFDEVAIDTETDGKDFLWKDQVLIMSLACGNRRVCLPSILAPILNPLFHDQKKLRIFANTKFDLHRLANIGIHVADPTADVIVMSMREDSSRPHHDLKFLSSDGLYERYDPRFNQYSDYATTFGRGDNAMVLLGLDTRDKVVNYATQDAWNTLTVFYELRDRLRNMDNPLTGNLWELYQRIEIPMTRILYEYERAGMLVDKKRLDEHRIPLHKELDELSRRASQKAGTPVNLKSPDQLVKLFIQTMKYPVVRQTDGGKSGARKSSVNEEVLRTWKKMPGTDKELLDIALESRKVVNRLGALKEIDGWRDPFGKVHSTVNQSGARTGRLSSSSPALQNKEKRFRDVFVAPPGWVVLDFDLEQVEMRLAGALAGDERMIKIINDGLDPHSMTVEMMEGIPYKDVDDAHRSKDRTPKQKELEALRNDKKRTGFGILYGETEWMLITQLSTLPSTNPDESKRLEENLAYAKGLQKKWLDQYPGIQRYIENVRAFISSTGYVSTLLGWRRTIPAGRLDFDVPEWKLMKQMRSRDWNEAMRQGTNASIQGSAADIMKLILIRIWKDPYLRDLMFQALLPVHDELVCVVKKEHAQDAMRRCLELAKNPQEDFGIHLPVDILADGGIGPNWKEAKS